MIETHPFGVFTPANVQCLVLGSFPTRTANWRFNWFYPGRANFFWRMLSEIYGRKFIHTTGDAAAGERRLLCEEKGIGISDVIYRCRRKVVTSSKDSDLEVIEKMNVLKMLREHKTIHTVILTGSSGPVSAHRIFYEHLTEHKIAFTVNDTKPPINGHFKLEKRTIEVHSLYSTSGINIGRYAEAKEQFKKYLPATE